MPVVARTYDDLRRWLGRGASVCLALASVIGLLIVISGHYLFGVVLGDTLVQFELGSVSFLASSYKEILDDRYDFDNGVFFAMDGGPCWELWLWSRLWDGQFIPLWPFLLGLVAARAGFQHLARTLLPDGACPCGYSLHGNVSGRCPECGRIVEALNGRRFSALKWVSRRIAVVFRWTVTFGALVSVLALRLSANHTVEVVFGPITTGWFQGQLGVAIGPSSQIGGIYWPQFHRNPCPWDRGGAEWVIAGYPAWIPVTILVVAAACLWFGRMYTARNADSGRQVA